MKLSHIIFKVNDLPKAVKEWEEKGFEVEYGKAKNPYNALIYFKDGPYIELLTFSELSPVVKGIFTLMGKKKFLAKMSHWAKHPEGLMSVLLENDKTDLESEIAISAKNKLSGVKMKKKRVDVKGRELGYTVFFTDDIGFPDYMTYFTVDPKPKENPHSNGITGVKSVSIGVESQRIPLLQELCQDEKLIIFEGNSVKDLLWEDEN